MFSDLIARVMVVGQKMNKCWEKIPEKQQEQIKKRVIEFLESTIKEQYFDAKLNKGR